MAVERAFPINAVIVGDRHRRELGDIEALAESIDRHGLLQAITVRPDRMLVCGARRLAACKALGWQTIPALVIDVDAVAGAEWAENMVREDLRPSEVHALYEALREIETTKARERMGAHGEPGKLSQAALAAQGRVRDVIGAQAGVSGRTVEKIAAVMEAARAEPARYAPLVSQMDRTGKVHGAYARLRVIQDEARVLNLAPVTGKFRTLLLDPPWREEQYSVDAQASTPYATMDVAAIAALPVPDWAEADCHLYLWVTNNRIGIGAQLIEGWGFQHRTILTWVKPHFGRGHWFRNQTEHLLVASRGSVGTRPAAVSIASFVEAPLGPHSAKPDRFYEIVAAASYPAIGEAFQRQARPGFIGLFEERRAAA